MFSFCVEKDYPVDMMRTMMSPKSYAAAAASLDTMMSNMIDPSSGKLFNMNLTDDKLK
jgi:hypothetical protein